MTTRKLRLVVTDHALVRMADWHPEFRQFVPRQVLLDYPQAQGVMNAIHVFVASLEKGRPATKPEKVTQYMAEKYRNARHLFIFDRALLDTYTMVLQEDVLTLVTVTALTHWHGRLVLDDPAPPCKFAEVTEIRVPYLLGCTLQDDPEFGSIRTPAGRTIPVVFDYQFTTRKSNLFTGSPDRHAQEDGHQP